MNKTEIAWTDRTWNPVSGCSHVSAGCKHCYAERLFPRPYPGRKFTDVRCHQERLAQPLKIKKPQKIFVNSMSDLFHEDVPDEFIDQVFAVMNMSPEHTYQVLTKRPERMQKYFVKGVANRIERAALNTYSWMPSDVDRIRAMPLPNVWLGISCEDQKTADERIPLLLQTPAAVRFLSCEPLLGPIDLWGKAFLEMAWSPEDPNGKPMWSGLDWVIIGSESGPKARPMDEQWARDIKNQCVAAGVPLFYKQDAINGKKIHTPELDGQRWMQFPAQK